MATYNDNAAYKQNQNYDLSMFEPAQRRRGAAAPSSAPARRQPLVPTMPERKSKVQLAEERRAAHLKVVVFAVAAVLCFALIAPSIFCHMKVNELNSQVAKMTTQLNEIKSENTRLNMELKSKISLENVQYYAENVLGMVKRDRYQVYYFDIENGNEILPAQ